MKFLFILSVTPTTYYSSTPTINRLLYWQFVFGLEALLKYFVIFWQVGKVEHFPSCCIAASSYPHTTVSGRFYLCNQDASWSRFLVNLTVARLISKFLFCYVKLKPLPCSQDPIPRQISHILILYLISDHILLDLSNVLLPSGFTTRMLYVFVISLNNLI